MARVPSFSACQAREGDAGGFGEVVEMVLAENLEKWLKEWMGWVGAVVGDWLVGWLVGGWVGGLVFGWLVGWLLACLLGWLVGWLVGWMLFVGSIQGLQSAWTGKVVTYLGFTHVIIVLLGI